MPHIAGGSAFFVRQLQRYVNMVHAYINYPNPHIAIHRSSGCGCIQQQHKEGQRVVKLNQATFSSEIQKFIEKHYRFASEQGTNDMWLEVDFDDTDFEVQVIEYLRKILVRHYSPFGRIKAEKHSCMGAVA
jgi:hypothetical protein